MLGIFIFTVLNAITEATLRERLLSLETRVSLDAIEFRNDISDLKDSLNKTCPTVDVNVHEQASGTHSSDPKNQNDYMKLFANFKEVVHNGFVEEKGYIRKFQEKMYNAIASISQTVENNTRQNDALLVKLNSQEESFKRLQVQQESTNQEIELLKESLLETGDGFNRNKERINQFEDKLHRIALENNDTVVITQKLVEEIDEMKRVVSCQLDGWISYDSSCYKPIRNKSSWADAVNACKSMGSYLVEIDNARENAFVVETIKNIDNVIWLGASDINDEGTFMWNHSHREVDSVYAGWRSGEPNGGTRENCISLETNNWNDLYCDRKRSYICERNI